jgi:hypothetical protein
MIGLLVLGILALWVAAAFWMARRLARAIPMKAGARPWASFGLFVLIFLLPVADELAARPSFNALCREGSTERIDAQRIAGRTVRLVVNPRNARLKGTFVPVYHSHFEYRDAQTGDVLGGYEVYLAEGGLIARKLRFPTSRPLTGAFLCAPEDEGSIPKRYGFTVLRWRA